MGDHGALDAAVLEIGGCDNDAVKGHKLPRAHRENVTAEDYVHTGVQNKLAVADGNGAAFTDDLINVIYLFGNAL